MNRISPSPVLAPKVDAPGFLPGLLNYLREIATAVNDLIDGRCWSSIETTVSVALGTGTRFVRCKPGAPMSVTLPDVAKTVDTITWVKRANSSVHVITVLTAAGQIDGAASVTLTTAWQCRGFYSDGTAYHVIT